MEPVSRKPLDRIRAAVRLQHSSIRTEQSLINGTERYFSFLHNVRYPDKRALLRLRPFLTHLAVNENIAAFPDE